MVLVLVGGAAQAVMVPVDISGVANTTYATASGMINGSTFPSGIQSFDGKPFDINGMWHSYSIYDADGTVDINVGQYGVSSVYTLMNSYWGTSNTNYYVQIDFFGTDDGAYTAYLYGNKNLRDYHNGSYTNLLDPSGNAQEVWINGRGQRIDMQAFVLPATFLDETLDFIRVTDYGADGTQRSFLSGLTVERNEGDVVPEPATMTLFGVGLAGMALRRKRS